MKHGAIRHPKLLRLARELRLPTYAALGLVEALIDWAFDWAREGDIGRHSDVDIAMGVGWEGEAATLIDALVTTRFVDRCPTHRLVIHDLADHATETWKRVMRRQGREFACAKACQSPDIDRTSPDIDRTSPDLSGPSASASASASEDPSAASPDPKSEVLDLPSSLARSAQKRSLARLARATTWPDGFPLTPELAAFAEAGGLNAKLEFAHFRDHHQAKGTRFVRWDLAFKTWCRRCDQFRRHA